MARPKSAYAQTAYGGMARAATAGRSPAWEHRVEPEDRNPIHLAATLVKGSATVHKLRPPILGPPMICERLHLI